MTEGREVLADIISVSRETEERLAAYVALLSKWQKAENLIAPSTLPTSGGGMWPTAPSWWRSFPRPGAGSISAAGPAFRAWSSRSSGRTAGTKVHLVESNRKKCAFLRAAIRETQAPAVVHEGRIDA